MTERETFSDQLKNLESLDKYIDKKIAEYIEKNENPIFKIEKLLTSDSMESLRYLYENTYWKREELVRILNEAIQYYSDGFTRYLMEMKEEEVKSLLSCSVDFKQNILVKNIDPKTTDICDIGTIWINELLTTVYTMEGYKDKKAIWTEASDYHDVRKFKSNMTKEVDGDDSCRDV